MELSKFSVPSVVLLKACCLLLCLSSASSALEDGCPLIAPLSSYSPSIPSSSTHFTLVTSQVSAELETRISSLILGNSIPFYAVSVVHEDQTVFTSGSVTSPFMIGSITKTFTAMGALMLRARGLLSLDDPVKKFLPDFSVINPYEDNYDITLRDLMGHVSGLPVELCAVTLVTSLNLPDQLDCPVDEADVLKFLAGMELVRPPWSREPSYSNLGFGVLGHAWEKATSPSKTWEQFVMEDILEPLGMTNSGVASNNETLVTNDSSGIYRTGFLGPSANMYSTATDLAKYLIFLLKAKPALLPAATIRQWTRPSTIFPDGNGGYALPWELLTINSTNKEFLITKDGELGNFLSIVAIHPPTQLGVSVLLSLNENSSLGPPQVMEEVLNYLIPLVKGKTAEIINPFYTGHYVCKPTPPINSQPLLAISQVLGGFIDIVGSLSLGLSASINVSVLLDGKLSPQIETVGLLLKNSTENSFWLGDIGTDCVAAFGDIGASPSRANPNYPGTYYGYEIEFDFAHNIVLWPAVGAICSKG